MKKVLIASVVILIALAILFSPALSIRTPVEAQSTTIFLYSDPRPDSFGPYGETALIEDFNQALDQMPLGWTLDCVQNIGDIDPISTGAYTLDNAYATSELASLPHFMCVGNHEAETPQDMIDIRAKFSDYPDWNLIAGPEYTSETTYSYDIGDIHIVVINEYWDGAYNDAWLKYGDGDGGYIPDALFEWIKDDLRTSTKPYKLIVGHEPGYPVGRHWEDSLNADPDNRDKFFNLLKTEGVIAYFTAHTHRYYLAEHDGVFEVNTGNCGAMVGNGDNDNFATLGYAHYDSDGFKIRMVREDTSLGWDSPSITTVTRSDLQTQILVNTADEAGTVCRYFIDYTVAAQPNNPDWSGYGPWWENDYDDVAAGWSNGELAVGYDNTNPDEWGWINQTIDPDPSDSGDEQVYGAFVRIPFTVYDKNAYPFMKLGVDYDDAVTVWLNGTKIYESPTSPTISSTDYWDKVATGSHSANGDEALNPNFDTIDVSAYMSSLNNGNNLLVIGNWNWGPGSSDLVAGVKLYLTKAVDLVSVGATWRYNDTGTDLGTSWREPSYDDSDWPSGPAELGYGDGDEATVIEYGPDPYNKYPCYYFRHSFNISDTSDYASLTFKVIRDDGAVVYLNGVEVFRTNMPAGEITFDTWASSRVMQAESTWYHTNVSEIDASNLVNGTNTIAVEIHQYSLTSSDVSFDLQLTAEANTFILISPPNGAVLFNPPTFAWTSGPYDAFLFYSIFSYGAYGYYPLYFWLSDTSFQMPANWWDLLAADELCYWAVIGVNIMTWDWEVSDVWLFKKAPDQCPQFDEGFPTGTIKSGDLDEASGLAASQKNPYVLWTHNDSGDSARVFAMNVLGTHLGTYNLSGASNRDWEDIAIGPGPIDGVDYLYIGEIGDNSAVYPSIKVYRVPEPQVDASQPPVNITLTGVETITLQYPDGARDAETLMVDPATKDIYIISKRDYHPRVYRAAYPQSTSQTITMEYKCELPWQYQTFRDWVTAGEISPDGSEVIVRSYDSASIWQRPTNGNLWDAFAQPECPVQLLTETETLGEAICFINGGYMTTSEGMYSAINYFPRISGGDLSIALMLLTPHKADSSSDFCTETDPHR